MQDTEFLVTFTMQVPEGTSPQALEEMKAGEARRTRELAGERRLVRLWALGQGRNPSLWQAPDADRLREYLDSLPMTAAGWLGIETVPLTRHPSDPATAPAAV